MVIATWGMSRIDGEGDRQEKEFRVAQTARSVVQLPLPIRKGLSKPLLLTDLPLMLPLRSIA